MLEKVLRKTVSLATHDYLILLISDFRGINATSKKHLLQMSRHNDVILAQISDPLEQKLPRERLVLSDGDLQLLWNSGQKKSAEKYQAIWDDTTKSFLADLEKYRLPIMQLDTVSPIDLQLKSLFSSKLKAGQ